MEKNTRKVWVKRNHRWIQVDRSIRDYGRNKRKRELKARTLAERAKASHKAN